jgi:ATP-dependent RNA helicase SUPV3L1/SUV3
MQIATPRSKVVAALGPTNTGKTYLAFERMLAHGSGMIGFPLRLLARENYDRAVEAKGARQVALITGEEKIVPPYAKYFFCTVEAMPVDKEVAFLAVDEIQMCGDPDRGHIFTDRLLHARGVEETMFMGAESMTNLLKRLVPGIEIISRPRFSTLSYAGGRKIIRLKPRSAVVGFSAGDVYAIAELIRRQRGGAAIVMGALSPRTRNAQVEMFQNGDVDYLVATDAIGMGLNMDVDHVAFAGLKKFDGTFRRDLRADELGQIAGRAGRHMNDGTFGVTGDAPDIPPEIVEAVQEHRYDPQRFAYWRNVELDYGSVDALRASLTRKPEIQGLTRVRATDDERFLMELSRDKALTEMAADQDAVRLFWEICRIPDFKKGLGGDHTGLLAQLYKMLAGGRRLPAEWVARQVSRIDQTDGGIETLVARIAGIRIWTYISHRPDWLDDPDHWQERTREIEDRLSDALHQRLTQRFVDQRTATLVKRLRDRDDLQASVTREGDVLVEGHYVGQLRGFRFQADASDSEVAGKAVSNAAFKALGREVARRASVLGSPGELENVSLKPDGRVYWHDDVIARLVKGATALSPRIELLHRELLETAQQEKLTVTLQAWLEGEIGVTLRALIKLQNAKLEGAVRGLVFQLVDGLGYLPKLVAGKQLKALVEKDYGALRRLEVKLGRREIFLPALTKPKPARLAAILWSVHRDLPDVPEMPPAGRVTLPNDGALPEGFREILGYRETGPLLIRVDILERFLGQLKRRAAKSPFTADAELLNLLGASVEEMTGVLAALNYESVETEGGQAFQLRTRPKKKKQKGRRKPPRPKTEIEDSPFAKLKELALDK